MTNLNNIIGLTDEQRLNAQDAAKAIVVRTIGQRPTWEQFNAAMVGRYPTWVTNIVGVLMLIVFVASAAPSLFRLFSAGRDYFLTGISDQNQAVIVGLSTFLLAEFVVILSTVSARIFFTGNGRYVFILPVLMGLMMALVGNWTVVNPHDIFSLLETIVPVATVLFVALIGERLLLDAVERQHEGKRRYQQALQDYKLATAHPDDHPKYRQAYANALKKELLLANAKGSGAQARRELMGNLAPTEWRELIDRELQGDEWFVNPAKVEAVREVVVVPKVPFGSNPPTRVDHEYTQMMQPATVSSNGNGTHGTN